MGEITRAAGNLHIYVSVIPQQELTIVQTIPSIKAKECHNKANVFIA